MFYTENVIRISANVFFSFLCILFFGGSCKNSTKQIIIRNVEMKQDIRSSGIIDISSKINFPIAPSETNLCFMPNTHWLGLGSAEKFGIKFSNQFGQYIETGYNVYYQFYYIECKHSTSLEAISNIQVQPFSINDAAILDIKIKLDTTSITLFSMNGDVELASMYYYSSEFNKMELFAENGKIFVNNMTVKRSK